MTRRHPHLRARLWVESGLAALAAVLAIVTAVVPDWIEQLTGAHPDGGGGEAEWLLALVPAALAVVLMLLALREWRRLLPA
jgi:hypothetical protein